MEGAAHVGKAILTEAQAVPAARQDEDSDGAAAIFLQHRSRIVIDGLVVEDPGGRFIYADGASCITVQSCRLEKTDCPKTRESCRLRLDYAGRAPDLGAFE